MRAAGGRERNTHFAFGARARVRDTERGARVEFFLSFFVWGGIVISIVIRCLSLI